MERMGVEKALSVTRSIAALPIGRFAEPVQMMEAIDSTGEHAESFYDLSGEISASSAHLLIVIQFFAQEAKATAGLEAGADDSALVLRHESSRRQTGWDRSIC
ncbi:hypothetical protein HM1_2080 [Heliomicrobium modesticaldum Ice1]|uniref:Uncharacterized protein n=2 Tax=Heliomicrobium modesticaldum TaxID=35701 RepID=B0TGE1_HELMI|nr:hypothetical protein HM1_2080 [Heliomicrobium modesticaldum Ice1]